MKDAHVSVTQMKGDVVSDMEMDPIGTQNTFTDTVTHLPICGTELNLLMGCGKKLEASTFSGHLCWGAAVCGTQSINPRV